MQVDTIETIVRILKEELQAKRLGQVHEYSRQLIDAVQEVIRADHAESSELARLAALFGSSATGNLQDPHVQHTLRSLAEAIQQKIGVYVAHPTYKTAPAAIIGDMLEALAEQDLARLQQGVRVLEQMVSTYRKIDSAEGDKIFEHFSRVQSFSRLGIRESAVRQNIERELRAMKGIIYQG
jgi:hypothetical protein